MLSLFGFIESTESVSSSVGAGSKGSEDLPIMSEEVLGGDHNESYDRLNPTGMLRSEIVESSLPRHRRNVRRALKSLDIFLDIGGHL